MSRSFELLVVVASWEFVEITMMMRPLKRAIQSSLLDLLSLALLDGRFASGDEITVFVADGELSFTK